jgi:hypothetical protein
MKKLLLIALTFVPLQAFAVPNLTVPEACESGECKFDQIVELANEIAVILISLVTAVATVMFVYAGFLYLTAQGDTGQIKKATGVFRTVVIGFVIILIAYMAVKELLIKLGVGFLINLFS